MLLTPESGLIIIVTLAVSLAMAALWRPSRAIGAIGIGAICCAGAALVVVADVAPVLALLAIASLCALVGVSQINSATGAETGWLAVACAGAVVAAAMTVLGVVEPPSLPLVLILLTVGGLLLLASDAPLRSGCVLVAIMAATVPFARREILDDVSGWAHLLALTAFVLPLIPIVRHARLRRRDWLSDPERLLEPLRVPGAIVLFCAGASVLVGAWSMARAGADGTATAALLASVGAMIAGHVARSVPVLQCGALTFVIAVWSVARAAGATGGLVEVIAMLAIASWLVLMAQVARRQCDDSGRPLTSSARVASFLSLMALLAGAATVVSGASLAGMSAPARSILLGAGVVHVAAWVSARRTFGGPVELAGLLVACVVVVVLMGMSGESVFAWRLGALGCLALSAVVSIERIAGARETVILSDPGSASATRDADAMVFSGAVFLALSILVVGPDRLVLVGLIVSVLTIAASRWQASPRAAAQVVPS